MDERSSKSDTFSALKTLISREVSLLRSLISTLIVLKAIDDKSEISVLIVELAAAI